MQLRALGIAIFVAGGLLVFQSSDSLDPSKVIYMLATLVAVAAAIARLVLERAEVLAQRMLLSWLTVSAAFGSLLVISFPVASAAGTPVTSWLRDAAPYAMFAFAPILAVDGRSLPRRFFVSLLIAGGTLASVSFAIEWLGLRGILELPIDRLVLPTGILAATLVAYAAARAMLERPSTRWVVLGGTILGLFFVTATRSTLLLIAVPCVVALLAPRGRSHALRVVGGTLAVALSVPLLFSVVVFQIPELIDSALTARPSESLPPGVSGQTPRPNPIGDRIESIGSAIAAPGNDASFSERIAQTRAAWDVFKDRPLFGSGPGHMIEWTSASRGPRVGFTLDTPLLYLAKFGMIGVVVLAWLIAVYLATLRRYRRSGPAIIFLTLAGFATVFVIAGLLNSPFEDKGLSFATLLVLGAAFAADRDAASDGADPPPSADAFWRRSWKTPRGRPTPDT
jgi:hypothetical protein